LLDNLDIITCKDQRENVQIIDKGSCCKCEFRRAGIGI